MKQVYKFFLVFNQNKKHNQLLNIDQVRQIDLFWKKLLENLRIEPDRKVVQDIIKKVSETV